VVNNERKNWVVDFARIKECVTVEHIAHMHKLALKGRGPQKRGECPVCGGDRTLAINTDKQMAYCFPTKKGGDSIWLHSHLTGKTQKEAAEDLSFRFKIDDGRRDPSVEPFTNPDIVLLKALRDRLSQEADNPDYTDAAKIAQELVDKLEEIGCAPHSSTKTRSRG
jgi:DNA primase